MSVYKAQEFEAKAKQLFEYFSHHAAHEGDYWNHGLTIVKKWQSLMTYPQPQLTEIQRLLNELKNPPEPQGTAYSELDYLISEWAKHFI